MLVPLTVGRPGGRRRPAADRRATRSVSAVLCAVGLVTFAGVVRARRAAAGWLLLCFASLAVTMVSGALAVALPVAASSMP